MSQLSAPRSCAPPGAYKAYTHLILMQVQHGLLAHTHYIHGAYILEIVKNQWEHNTIKVRFVQMRRMNPLITR